MPRTVPDAVEKTVNKTDKISTLIELTYQGGREKINCEWRSVTCRKIMEERGKEVYAVHLGWPGRASREWQHLPQRSQWSHGARAHGRMWREPPRQSGHQETSQQRKDANVAGRGKQKE